MLYVRTRTYKIRKSSYRTPAGRAQYPVSRVDALHTAHGGGRRGGGGFRIPVNRNGYHYPLPVNDERYAGTSCVVVLSPLSPHAKRLDTI